MMKAVAVYKSVEYDYTTIKEVTEEEEENNRYLRLTEIVEMEFPELSQSVLVAKEVEILQEAKQEARAKLIKAIEQIDDKIQNLLAITHQPEERF